MLKKFLASWKRRLFWMRGFLPIQLPTDSPALERLFSYLFFTYEFPDYPSYRQAVCAKILHTKEGVITITGYTFYKLIKAAQAKQVAYEIVDKMRIEEKAQQDRILKAVNAPKEEAKPATNESHITVR